MARTILFLTDYGLQDEFVGVCHAVIARLAPDARVIDLAHGIAPGDVLAGAVGDVREAVSLDPERVALGPVFATFHGRDLFAPAAARLARGDALDQLGERVDPAS